MNIAFPLKHCTSRVFKLGFSSPSLNFSFMPSKVKAKPAQLPSTGIVTLFKKQDQDKNICIATFKSMSSC